MVLLGGGRCLMSELPLYYSETRHPKSEARIWKPETRNPKLDLRNPNPVYASVRKNDAFDEETAWGQKHGM